MIVRRSNERGYMDHGWLQTHHSFSFASYYDPLHVHFRSLRVLNDDTIAPHAGFPTHPHENMEILTCVLAGAVTHTDSMGFQDTIHAGECQLISAGTGITHSEMNHGDTPLRLLQLWVMPEHKNTTPAYHVIRPQWADCRNHAPLIASPHPAAGVLPIGQDVAIRMGHFDAGIMTTLTIEKGRHLYLYIIDGWVAIGGVLGTPGDALMGVSEGGVTLEIIRPAHLLVFDLK